MTATSFNPIVSALLLKLYRAHIPFRLLFRAALAALCRTGLAWVPTRREGGRTAVAVGRDRLSVNYAHAYLREHVPQDCRKFLYVPRGLKPYVSTLLKDSDITPVGLLTLLRSKWDLAAFSSHRWAPFLNPHTRRLWIGHGVATGKLIYGDYCYVYSWKALRRYGRCAYDVMVGTSRWERGLPLRQPYALPQRDKILLAQEVYVARYLAAASAVTSRKKEKGKVVLCSTWGSHSNLSILGREFFEIARRLSRSYQVLVTVHPHFYPLSETVRDEFEALREEGIGLIAPDPDSWIRETADADLMVGDRSALSIYFALLGRPVCFFGHVKDPGQLTDPSPLGKLISYSPTVDPGNITAQVASVLRESSSDRSLLQEVAADIQRAPNLKQVSSRLLNGEDPFVDRRAASSSVPHLSVCIATYRRPGLLANLLENGLLPQVTDGKFTFSVHVCDNDVHRSAWEVVRRFSGRLDITYEHVPEQNISLARNQALFASKGDYIAIIDDDVQPERDWLRHLLETALTYNADVVRGPIYTNFRPGTLLSSCQLYAEKSRSRKDGPCSRMPLDTCNSLIRFQLIQSLGLRFSPEFGLTGGEDLDFFIRLQLEGALFAWSGGARVHSTLHPRRDCLKHAVGRVFNRGRLRAKIELRHRLSRGARWATGGKALVLTLFSFALGPLFLLNGRMGAKYLTKLAYHLGYVDYWLRGRIYEEYRSSPVTELAVPALPEVSG